MIQRVYWLPFPAIFFCCACLLAPVKRRKLMSLLCFAGVLIAGVRSIWSVWTPSCYELTKTADSSGICMQSTGYTCGPSSLVCYLHTLGIRASEGEMARLSRCTPVDGITEMMAARALKQKLTDPSTRVQLIASSPEQLDKLPTPFLTTIRLNAFTGHMICVLETSADKVTIADPLQGRISQSKTEFISNWKQLAIYSE